MSNYALFINGVHKSVLEEILDSQDQEPSRTHYLQPYSADPIKWLQQAPPSEGLPIPLYMSITSDLRNVHYKAEIVGWEDKRDLSQARRAELMKALVEHQPEEGGLYNASQTPGGESVNLISISKLKRFEPPVSVQQLVKKSDGKSLSPNRSRSGGFSYVWPPDGL